MIKSNYLIWLGAKTKYHFPFIFSREKETNNTISEINYSSCNINIYSKYHQSYLISESEKTDPYNGSL